MVYVVQQKHDVKISTRATRTFMPVRFRYLFEPDSLPTVLAFFQALSSVVDMIQEHYDSIGVVILVVSVAPVIPRSPTCLFEIRATPAPHGATKSYWRKNVPQTKTRQTKSVERSGPRSPIRRGIVETWEFQYDAATTSP